MSGIPNVVEVDDARIGTLQPAEQPMTVKAYWDYHKAPVLETKDTVKVAKAVTLVISH